MSIKIVATCDRCNQEATFTDADRAAKDPFIASCWIEFHSAKGASIPLEPQPMLCGPCREDVIEQINGIMEDVCKPKKR